MIEPQKIKKVLVFALMGIGNLIMFIPTLKAFKNYFPKAKFSLVLSGKHLIPFKEILDNFCLIDEFIVFDGKHASIREKIKFINKIRNANFDLLVKNFLGGINLMLPSLRIPHRIGHISSPDFPIRFGFVFNYPVVMGNGEHEIDRNLRLFYAIADKVGRVESIPELSTHEVSQQKVAYIIREPRPANRKPLIAMQIGTSAIGDWKEWAAQRFGELANKLISDYGIRVILLGDEKAKNKGNIVERNVQSKDNLINLIGNTSIMEVAAIIKSCILLISNDAGLMWIAQSVGTPVVAIYGPTDYRRTGPLGVRDKIIRKDLACSPCYKSPVDYTKAAKCKTKQCLTSITTQEVLDVIAEFL